MGVTKLRIARFGQKDKPIFRIVATDSRSPRDSSFKEIVGEYHPTPDEFGTKHIKLNAERVKYWIGVGAQLTDMIEFLIGKAGILPMPPDRYRPTKQAKREKFQQTLAASQQKKKFSTLTVDSYIKNTMYSNGKI